MILKRVTHSVCCSVKNVGRVLLVKAAGVSSLKVIRREAVGKPIKYAISSTAEGTIS